MKWIRTGEMWYSKALAEIRYSCNKPCLANLSRKVENLMPRSLAAALLFPSACMSACSSNSRSAKTVLVAGRSSDHCKAADFITDAYWKASTKTQRLLIQQGLLMSIEMPGLFAKSLSPFWHHIELFLLNLPKMDVDIEPKTHIYEKNLRKSDSISGYDKLSLIMSM